MLTHEQNERLTRVGPGTPGGELLRRYWHVLCPTAQFGAAGGLRIRILGEDLFALRKNDGTYGAVEQSSIRPYPVRALSGLLFIYMGPHAESPPLLPRWDVLARTDRPKQITVLPVHNCNWLQIQENTADSVHTYYLHGHRMKMLGLPGGDFFYRQILAYDWSECEWGVEKRVTYAGNPPDLEVRPPLIFPNVLRIPEGQIEALHFRVPIDDEHTRIIWFGLMPPSFGPVTGDDRIDTRFEPDTPGTRVEDVDITTFYGQDRVVWETQGAIADRSRETLGATDRGIVLFRRQLAEQIDRVAAGLEPTLAVVHDEAQNICITFESSKRVDAGAHVRAG